MKIDKPSKPSPVSPAGEGVSHAKARGKSATPAASQQSDSTSVSLGAASLQLNTMAGSMANTPIVDADKVAEITQAISEGRFKVNSEVVADRLIETVRELIDSKNT